MTDRAAYIAGLRQLADALEAHPEVPLPTDGTRMPLSWNLWDDDAREQMAATARALPVAWVKETREGYDGGPDYFDLSGKLGGLKVKLTACRDAVCTRVVTGTEDREVEEVVTPAVTRKITQPAEVVEWRCESILAPVPS